MRATGEMGVDLLARHGLEEVHELRAECVLGRVVVVRRGLGRGRDGGRQLDLAHGGHKRDDLNAVRELEILLGDRTGRDASYSLAGAATSATAARFDAVLLEVSPVGVAGTRVQIRLRRRINYCCIAYRSKNAK